MSSLIRFYYHPFVGSDDLFDDAFNTYFWPSSGSVERRQRTSSAFRPRLDLHESKDSNVVTATFELPGVKSEDITIDVHHNRLTVSGDSAATTSHEEGGYSVHERRNGKFSRMLQLPFGTKPEDVQAKMENGLLTVTFPKENPEQQPQRISVQ